MSRRRTAGMNRELLGFFGERLGQQTDRATGKPAMATLAAGILTHRLRQAVEDNGEDNDTRTPYRRQTHIQTADAAQNHLTQTAHGDHRGDNHHRQRQHQRLVNTRHDGWHRQRQLYFEQQLAWAGPEGLRGLNQVFRYLINPENGQAHNRRQGEDNSDDNPWHITDTKQHDDRHQIDERRRGLHGIEQRTDNFRRAFTARQPYAER